MLLGLADKLGAGFAVAFDESLKESIDLRLECLFEGNQRSEAARGIPDRDIALFGEAKEERLDRVALQARKPELQLVEGARPRTAEAGEHLPFAWRRERGAFHGRDSK